MIENFMKNSWLKVAFLLLAISNNAVFAADTAVDNPVSAKQVVAEFQNTLLEVMKHGKELGFEGRYQKLDSAVKKSHALKKIARIVVGREWKKLTPEQQAELVKVFTQLSVSAYAYNFKEYSGESFKFVSEEDTARGGKIVHALLVIPDDSDVKFDYMLKKINGQWKIINIIADGVSDLAVRRSEYTSLLKNQGFDVLIAKMKEKIKNYSK